MKTTNRTAVILLSMLLGACATNEAPEFKRMSVTQVGMGSGSEYVACNGCPEPGRKTVFVAPPQPKIEPVKKVEPVSVAPAVVVTLKVHFRWGWGVLDAAGRKELVAVIAEAKKGGTVEVLGRTDPTGGVKRNERLALKRAETVRKELIAAGIPAASIVAGKHKPCCDGDLKGAAAAHKELRRTDVEITIKTTRS